MSENKDIDFRAMKKDSLPNNQSSARIIVPMLFEAIHPQSVIDIGCGIGVWLNEFKKCGAKTIQGVDGKWVLDGWEKDLLIKKENIEIFDFEDKKGSLKCIQNQKYDMAVCLEMAEHVSKVKADFVIKTLTDAADVIYFSAATPNSGGMHHVNEQWQSYWIQKFAKKGFEVIDYIRPQVWNNNQVCYFYAEESFVFIKREKMHLFPLLESAHNNTCMFNVVHPIHFKVQVIKSTHEWSYLFDLQKRLVHAYKDKLMDALKRKSKTWPQATGHQTSITKIKS